MDADNLEEIYANLSLDDTPLPQLEVDDDIVAAERHRVDNCLVGKMLTTHSVNREAFQSSMARL